MFNFRSARCFPALCTNRLIFRRVWLVRRDCTFRACGNGQRGSQCLDLPVVGVYCSKVNRSSTKTHHTICGILCRSPAAGIDSNNNRAMGLPRDEITSSQTHFRSREKSPETPPFDTPDSNHVHEIQQSKRRLVCPCICLFYFI